MGVGGGVGLGGRVARGRGLRVNKLRIFFVFFLGGGLTNFSLGGTN